MNDSAQTSADALLREWRARISRRLLGGLGIAGFVLMVIFNETLTLVSLAMGVSMTLALVGIAIWPRAPELLRSLVMLAGLTYAGAVSLFAGQDYGASILYLLAGVVLLAVLLGWKLAALYLVAGTGIVALGAWSQSTGVVLVTPLEPLPPSLMLAGNAVSLLIIGGVVLASLTFLMERLRVTLGERGEALVELERESSERAKALVQLEGALESLQATQARLVTAGKMELLGQLAGGIAHDMNNALTVVLGEAGLLYDQAPEEAQAITDAVEHASNLTRQLLAMGRREVVQPRAIEFGSTVERASSMLRRTLPSDVVLDLRVEPDVVVRADPNQIQQVILNLGTNAAHAMAQGGELRVCVESVGEQARLEITDTGRGMDEQTLARIFEPFFTTKAVGVGTGLGLPSVRAVVEALGGQIRCESQVGEGTCFTIELPRLDASELHGVQRAQAAESSLRLDGYRVLVADDEVRVRAVVTTTLQEAGAKVVDAGSADAAIALAGQTGEAFDLLWTDVVMPEGGGDSLVAWFSEHSPSTQIMVCTGYSNDEVLRRDVALGRYRLLHKPFSRAEALGACVAALS